MAESFSSAITECLSDEKSGHDFYHTINNHHPRVLLWITGSYPLEIPSEMEQNIAASYHLVRTVPSSVLANSKESPIILRSVSQKC